MKQENISTYTLYTSGDLYMTGIYCSKLVALPWNYARFGRDPPAMQTAEKHASWMNSFIKKQARLQHSSPSTKMGCSLVYHAKSLGSSCMTQFQSAPSDGPEISKTEHALSNLRSNVVWVFKSWEWDDIDEKIPSIMVTIFADRDLQWILYISVTTCEQGERSAWNFDLI